MSQRNNKASVWRVLGAVFFAALLWGITALSDTYISSMSLPLRVDLPPDQALLEPLPSTIQVTLRASGWALLKMKAAGQTECVLHPAVRGQEKQREVMVDRTALLTEVRAGLPGAEQVTNVYPDSLTMVIGRVASKRVPLIPVGAINTRQGFEVIGSYQIAPDSVTIIGSTKALQGITAWTTEPIQLEDIHQPVSRMRIRVSDTLPGVVRPTPLIAELSADVQETAERAFPDVPIINRAAARDTTLKLVLQPERVEILVRGGARDLSRLNPRLLRAWIDVAPGIDTLGYARPRLLNLPPGLRVIRFNPERVRYLWRKER
ncbi:MAG: hypothetical protein JNJ94_02095 [Chlorobi bacterium]|nr:hypothetical protein [Chlorobiota bacterium]